MNEKKLSHGEVERQPESLSSWVARLEFKEFDIAFFNLVEPSDSFLSSPLSCFCCVWCLVMSASLAQISAFLDATSSVFRDLGWHSHFQFFPNTKTIPVFPSQFFPSVRLFRALFWNSHLPVPVSYPTQAWKKQKSHWSWCCLYSPTWPHGP